VPTAVWSKLVGQLDLQSVPFVRLMSPTHAEYVANWIFDKIQDALGKDVGPHSAGLGPDHHQSGSARTEPSV